MTAIKVLGALLGAAACLIPFLALTDEYQRAIALDPQQARVISVDGELVGYEVQSAGSSYDDDGDGWIGPYTTDGVPEAARAALHPGDSVVARGSQLELTLSPPTPLFLVGFVACLLLGVWIVVAAIRERRAIAAARSDPMAMIELMVRKTRSAKIVASLTFLVFGAGLVALAIALEGEPLWQRLVIAAGGFLCATFVVWAGYGAWTLRDPKNAPVLRAIREEPQRIVWIYEHILVRNGVPIHTLWVCRDDGEKYHFSLGQLRADPLVQSLARVLPHAILGYSREREAAYKSSPASFRAPAVAA